MRLCADRSLLLLNNSFSFESFAGGGMPLGGNWKHRMRNTFPRKCSSQGSQDNNDWEESVPQKRGEPTRSTGERGTSRHTAAYSEPQTPHGNMVQ